MSSPLAFAVTLGVGLVAAGCGALPDLPGGPVRMGGDESRICMSSPDGGKLVGEMLTVADGAEVTVTGVSLVDAQNLQIDDAWLSTRLDAAIGTAEYPPSGNVTWDERFDADGGALEGGIANLIVLVSRTGDPATASAIAIDYESDGMNYRATGTTALTMKADCSE